MSIFDILFVAIYAGCGILMAQLVGARFGVALGFGGFVAGFAMAMIVIRLLHFLTAATLFTIGGSQSFRHARLCRS